jgi:endonuclease/exonuclease/phosphatase family metal-dependent hydrolase
MLKRRDILRWLLLVAFALLPVAMLKAAETNTLNVMSYNVRFASPKPPNAWPERRPLMQACIRSLQPDIFGTQEGVYYQLKDIVTDLPEYRWIGTGRDGGSRGEFMAIFYRADRFDALEYDHYWLSDTPEVIGSATWGNTNKRMVTWIKFRDLLMKREFYVVNTHFDHQVQLARMNSAKLVLERINALKTTLPVFLIGDFNAVAGSNPAYDHLTSAESGFRDSWNTAAKRTGEGLDTFNGFKEIGKQGRRIDWILYRGAVKPLMTEIVPYVKNGQFPSDHHPLITRFAFEAAQ